MEHRNDIYSFVAVRGSIPIFWKQKQAGLNSKIKVTRNELMTQALFEQNLNQLLDDYGNTILINLVSQTRKEEHILSIFYLKMLELVQKKDLRLKEGIQYVSYDFHKETTGDKFHKISDLMNQVSGLQKNFKYFHVTQQSDGSSNIKKMQEGVFRVNCIDCLDRTNVTMTNLSLVFIDHLLKRIRQAFRQKYSGTDDTDNYV